MLPPVNFCWEVKRTFLRLILELIYNIKSYLSFLDGDREIAVLFISFFSLYIKIIIKIKTLT